MELFQEDDYEEAYRNIPSEYWRSKADEMEADEAEQPPSGWHRAKGMFVRLRQRGGLRLETVIVSRLAPHCLIKSTVDRGTICLLSFRSYMSDLG